MRRINTAVLMAGLISLASCAAYSASPYTPDGFNYTVAIDHRTGDQSSYVGLTWNLKPEPTPPR